LQISNPAGELFIVLACQLLIGEIVRKSVGFPTQIKIVENRQIFMAGTVKRPNRQGTLIELLRFRKLSLLARQDGELVVGIQILRVGRDGLIKGLLSPGVVAASAVNQAEIQRDARQPGIAVGEVNENPLRL